MKFIKYFSSYIMRLSGQRHYRILLSMGLVAIILAACETPEKLMKSQDIKHQEDVATAWYNKKEYSKCIPVFEELMGLMKGRTSTEHIYYMYCMANYKQGDYMIAAYHFKNFATTYPLSDKAEESYFLSAMCNEKLSPKYELDQTYTTKAIDALQTFINLYPDSKRLDSANKVMTTLRKKLEKKALSNAELYYKTENYKAAALSFENLLVQYPDIDNAERILYMVVKSYNKYAANSIATKRVDRYHSVIDAYKNFVYKFPKSKYAPEAAKYERGAHFSATEAAYEKVFMYIPEEREKQFLLAIKECNTQLPQITDPDEIRKCNLTIERCYYGIVKNYFDLAEEQADTNIVKRDIKKASFLEKSIKSYYTFVDKYKDSRYYKDAEKLFTLGSEKLEKLKQYGQKQKD